MGCLSHSHFPVCAASRMDNRYGLVISTSTSCSTASDRNYVRGGTQLEYQKLEDPPQSCRSSQLHLPKPDQSTRKQGRKTHMETPLHSLHTYGQTLVENIVAGLGIG